MEISKIRNFSIVAHIDHGKSTLADRIIEICGGMDERTKKDQVLDSMDIERERGITIKAQTVRLNYKHTDGNSYQLNILHLPGNCVFYAKRGRHSYPHLVFMSGKQILIKNNIKLHVFVDFLFFSGSRNYSTKH